MRWVGSCIVSDETESWGQKHVSAGELALWVIGFAVVIATVIGLPDFSSKRPVTAPTTSRTAAVSCDEFNVCTPSNASAHVKLCNAIMSEGRAYVAERKFDLAVQASLRASQMGCDDSN